jgi:hypothetical protein
MLECKLKWLSKGTLNWNKTVASHPTTHLIQPKMLKKPLKWFHLSPVDGND